MQASRSLLYSTPLFDLVEAVNATLAHPTGLAALRSRDYYALNWIDP
jgi:hypothetical protein